MLSVWSNGREDELKQIAQQLLDDGSSKAYLSPNEQVLFAEVLKHGPKTWSKFMNGEIPCRVRVSDLTSEEEQPTTSILDIDSVKLAFQVRYMLYDAALPGLYGHPVPEVFEPVNKASNDTKANEDDEYDDEVEEEPEKVPEILDVEAVEDDDPRAQARTMYNYYRMFHTLEGDLDTVLKYKKLQENDREVDLDTAPKSLEKLASSVQFGAANLSLKHLLGVIESKREDMGLTDVELRNLISDVRKNRSKWASEDRIGQEELYEACEKVVLELRATTEHSTAFLNKVSKRDAPNYYQIIKYPMDLNTVMKKLKGLQYNSKKEFVDDLMAIWSNCLTYNSDPKHFLRSHAISMRKKTFALIALIPDITIRSREEVEAEAQAEVQAELQAEEQETRGKGLKGQKRRATDDNTSAAPTEVKTEDLGEANSSSPAVTQSSDAVSTPLKDQAASTESPKTSAQESNPPSQEPKEVSQEAAASAGTPNDSSASIASGATVRNGALKEELNGTQKDTKNQPAQLNGENIENSIEESEKDGAIDTTLRDTPIDGDGDEEEEEEAEIDHTNQDDDWESSVWRRNLTKKRSDYLYARNSLFRNNRIQPNAPVIVRTPASMGRFFELERKFFSPEKIQRIEEYPLFEYETASTFPGEPNSSATEKLPSMQDLPATKLLASGELNDLYNKNLNEIQKIRRICSKINVIKEMQQFPTTFVPAAGPKFPDIKDPEPDVSSRLPGAEPMYKPAIAATLRRSIAKVSMAAGFEACQQTAADAFADIAGDYLYRTAKLLHDNLENPDLDSKPENIIIGTLKNMGIPKTATLGRHLTDDIVRYNRKLLDLKANVSTMLTSMLRPAGLDRYRDEEFKDNSDQFVLGQFSSDIGDDYFGFKEMGIDKELGIENIDIPFHLLQQKVAPESASNTAMSNAHHIQQLPEYPAITNDALPNLIGPVKRFMEKSFEDKRLVSEGELLEDEQLGTKLKFVRPRIPVTGKIPAKRKPKSLLFIKPQKTTPVSPSAISTTTPASTVLPESAASEINGADIDLALSAFETFSGAI